MADWLGPPRPVILVPSAAAIDPIAANYPRASVLALPSDATVLRDPESWAWWMRLFQADVTLWPVDCLSEPFFEAVVPILRDAGVRTLRHAEPDPGDWSRYAALHTVWRDLGPARPA